MDGMDIKNLTLEVLKDTPAKAQFEKAFDIYEKAQNTALALSNINDQQTLSITKIGTVLSLNFFGMLLSGKPPKDITDEDWKKIADEVMDKAVLMDGQSYSIYIFDLYSEYIVVSANVLDSRIPDDNRKRQINEIKKLSEELSDRKSKLLNGEIVEAAYTEDCLWISLDAMIKCLAAYIGIFTGEELSALITAASTLTFEYGRLVLYRREQELLEEYIRNQYALEEQLEVKFNAFKAELAEETKRFSTVIANAFDTNIREALAGSVELARKVGVKEEEILKSTEDIDDFFLG